MRFQSAGAIAGIALICAGPAQAESLFQALTRPGACFARQYDSAHLAAHARQTVTRFALSDPGAEWRATQRPQQFSVAFAFQIRGGRGWYSGIGICTPQGAGARCDAEGDGGAFTLTRNRTGVRVAVSRLEAEGAHDFSPDLAAGDNRVMLLFPAPAQGCPAP